MNRTMIQPKWIWPSVIIFSGLLAGTLSLANSTLWLRPLAGLWFLLVCPGMAFVGLLAVREQGTRWTLAVALSLALDALVASFLIYANLWSPNTALVILIAASLTGASLQVIRDKVPAGNTFQRRKNGDASPSALTGEPGGQNYLPIPSTEEKSTALADYQETILLINTDADSSTSVAKYLRAAGYRVDSSHSIEEAARLISKVKPGLILVDSATFGVKGWSDLQQLREKSKQPILVKGGKLEVGDVVQGFQFGADDYVSKTISHARLAERIVALCPQVRPIHAVNGIVSSEGLRVDLTRRQVTAGGQPVELTENEFSLLAFFARNPNRTIPLESLRAGLGELNHDVSIRTIRRQIQSLRTKIEADPSSPKHIITRRAYGYRFE